MAKRKVEVKKVDDLDLFILCAAKRLKNDPSLSKRSREILQANEISIEQDIRDSAAPPLPPVRVNVDILKSLATAETHFFVTRGKVNYIMTDSQNVTEVHLFHIIHQQDRACWGLIKNDPTSDSVLKFPETKSFEWHWQVIDEVNWKPLLSLSNWQKKRMTRLLGQEMPFSDFDCINFFAWMTQKTCPTSKCPLDYLNQFSLDPCHPFMNSDLIQEGDWILMLIHESKSDDPPVRFLVHAAWCVGPNLYFSKFGAGYFVFCSLEDLLKGYPQADCFQIIKKRL